MKDKYMASNRGFASFNTAKRKYVSSLGGKAAWKKGTAHRWSSGEAKTAGAKGGKISKRKKKP